MKDDSRSAGEHLARYEQFVPLPRGEVFAFFADAGNLERITPPELKFRMVTELPIRMEQGRLIEYRLRLFGVAFSWRTLIAQWNPPDSFVDQQLSGPYRTWIHTHTFAEMPGGTMVCDEIVYSLPMYPVGEIAWPMVRFQVDRIFAHRRRKIDKLLGGVAPPGAA